MLELGSEIVLERPGRIDPEAPELEAICLSTAELAECTCPDFCERDHDVD
jgi:hypothetical protein